MPPLSLYLPAELRAKAEARAAEAGHSSLEHYIESLIRADVDIDEFGALDRLTFRSREQLEKLVLEGLASGSSKELTDADWEEKRRRLLERHSGGRVQ